MFVNSVPVDVIGAAYRIAANYLKKTGRIPQDLNLHEALFDSIVEDYRAGNRNKLRLANRAIARIERAEVVELVSQSCRADKSRLPPPEIKPSATGD